MKKIVFLIVAIVAVVGGYNFYKMKNAPEQNGEILLYGNVDIRDVDLGFRVAGRIEKLNFQEGDVVKKGDVLAVLDKEPFEAENALYQANFDAAGVTLKNTESLYQRRSELVAKGAVSKEEFENLSAKIEEARALQAAASAQLRQAQIRLRDTELVAPEDGVVLTRVQEPGAITSAGAVVFSVALNDPVWVRTYITEPDLGRIHPGMEVVVRTDSGGEYAGQVGYISPQAEFTPKSVETARLRTDLVYRLRVIVSNPDNGLRQGMPVDVLVKKGD